MRQRTYLDANAGSPLLAEVRDGIVALLDDVANPSSVHKEGRKARGLVEAARGKVASAVGARPANVIFTSGGTEAAVLALTPRLIRGKRGVSAGQLYVGATEHPCVLAGGRFAESAITRLPVLPSGVIDLAALDYALAAHDHASGAPYVALMLANNETGVIHPVAEAAAIVKRHGGILFCDAVQALGRVPLDIAALGADFVSISAHKLGGPQGAGALILAEEDFRPEPLITGGGQESRRRSGTENLISIFGFGIAAEGVEHHVREADRLAALRAKLEAGIVAVAPDAEIAGSGVERIRNTTMFVVPGLVAETAVIAFDLEGVAVSAGSACSSGKVAASHVLEAMGQGRRARSGIRVSLPAGAGEADVEAFVEAWRAVHSRMVPSQAA